MSDTQASLDLLEKKKYLKNRCFFGTKKNALFFGDTPPKHSTRKKIHRIPLRGGPSPSRGCTCAPPSLPLSRLHFTPPLLFYNVPKHLA